MAALIQVDWRKEIGPSKLRSDMQVTLTNMDQSGVAAIELSDPNRQNTTRLEIIDDFMMWARIA
ncbi:MAG: hypothetical protein Q9191_008376, partial [Dirinaria sp. TL-2023a]